MAVLSVWGQPYGRCSTEFPDLGFLPDFSTHPSMRPVTPRLLPSSPISLVSFPDPLSDWMQNRATCGELDYPIRFRRPLDRTVHSTSLSLRPVIGTGAPCNITNC
jgi:hypothetical protein